MTGSDPERAVEEMEELVRRLESGTRAWGYDSEPYVQWKEEARNLIRRTYAGDEMQDRLRAYDTAVSHGVSWMSESATQAAFQQNLPQLTGHMKALLSDLRARVEVAETPSRSRMGGASTVRVFIAHGGRTKTREKLERFIRALGAEPVVFEEQETMAATPSTKVDALIEGCDYGVVLVTKAGASVQDGKAHPRGNVVDEFARARQAFATQWMVMVEKGVELPSNVREFVREGFSRVSMDGALTALVRELRAHGMLSVCGIAERG